MCACVCEGGGEARKICVAMLQCVHTVQVAIFHVAGVANITCIQQLEVPQR